MTALREAIERNDGAAVDALLAQDSSLAADTYFAGDQPAGCPKCGSRTAFTEGSGADGPQQVHFCGPCDYAFVVVEDLDPEEPMDLDRDTYQLHTAALRADLPALRQAVREGADLDAPDALGRTPRQVAAGNADVLAAMSQGRSAWEQRERATDEHASLAPVETLEAKLARLEAENAQLRLEREKLKTSLQGVLELNAPSPAPRRASP